MASDWYVAGKRTLPSGLVEIEVAFSNLRRVRITLPRSQTTMAGIAFAVDSLRGSLSTPAPRQP